MSMRPFSGDIRFSDKSASRDTLPSTSNTTTGHQSAPVIEDKLATGAKGTDLDNNSNLDSAPVDLYSMALTSLKQIIQGTIFETSEDVLDPTRPVRPRIAGSIPKPYSEHRNTEVDTSNDDADQPNDELQYLEDDENEQRERDEEQTQDDTTVDEVLPEDQSEEYEEYDQDQELGIQDEETDEGSEEEPMILDDEDEDVETESMVQKDTSLTDFDVSQTLMTNETYLVFVPSGETIEAQFFSLLTSLWIAKHSNRTLIIPPPMMAPPSLYHIYPFFAGLKGRKRQRWSTLFDLRIISYSQPIVMIDNTRPVLQIPFTDEMAKEEENPTVNSQAVPYSPEVDTGGYTAPTTIKCHGPPAAGSWKTLDFAGRHFLNRYNLVADFKILEDSYWDLRPEAIERYWQASPSLHGEEQEDRQRQLICISGAEFIGAEDPLIEERMWREIGSLIPISNGIKQFARQTVTQVLRALEGDGRRHGYIGVHIDKLPSREFCRTEQAGKESYIPTIFTGAQTSGLAPSQCQWRVELIAKRIAILQRTVESIERPVIVTTTETDPDILTKMDQQPGWLRIGDDDGTGLFDLSTDEFGGYGSAVSRAFVMASSAVFVGSRESALAIHAAFRIKYEHGTKLINGYRPRWELY
ncbi:hypothetical protein BGX27_002124 [Mortierella sp. AM989]|nr:hypothetical protein BGX27_002124 [Mortierella sp. AM989]